MKTQYLNPSILLGVLLLAAPLLNAQPFFEGEQAPDFTLTNRLTGEPFRLHDLEDTLIVLDFFAYWCAPCAFSSPDLEENIQRHYAEAGGNPQGLRVQVVSMNLEREDPASTDAFVEQVGMELVVDDTGFEAFGLFNDTGGIPLFVVINGYANARGMEQWEILLNQAGYPGAEAIRNILDPVELDPVSESIPFSGLVDSGDGWRLSPWFGWINTAGAPLHLHAELGWIFIPADSVEERLFYYDLQQGWLFTSRDLYPNIFSFPEASWLRHLPGSNGWFWHSGDEQWKQYPEN